MMKYWSFLLFVVMFCSGLVITGEAKASSKDEAIILLQELQQNSVGEAWIDYDNAINLLEQGGSKKGLQTAFNRLMIGFDNGEAESLGIVSDLYFRLRLNPRPKVGGVYTNISGFVYTVSVNGNKTKSDGSAYFWNYLRTILLYKFSATASNGYSGRIWVQRYDCRGKVTSSGKYSAWRNDYLPAYPSAVLSFNIYN